jgi:hypothetical protein
MWRPAPFITSGIMTPIPVRERVCDHVRKVVEG